MNQFKTTIKRTLEYILPSLVLAVLLVLTYARFFRHGYGIWWTSDGVVSTVFVNEREPTIHVGDKLIRVGAIDYQHFRSDLKLDLFQNAKGGDVVPVVVERDGQQLEVLWRVPGLNAGELRQEFFSQWFLAYVFWIAGTMTMLLLRPRDMRWLLLSTFDYLTGLWILAGSGLSFFHIWYSALILRMVIWVGVPVTLHLHWVFPRSLGKLPRPALWGTYAFFGALAIAQWFQLVPASLFFGGFLLAICGGLVLLVVHAVRQPDMRRELNLLLIAAGLAVVPSIAIGIVGLVQASSPPALTIALLSFPVLPFAYLYAAYRRQLGGLEIRVNRLISIYSFIILLIAIVVPTLVLVDRLPVYSREQALITSVIASTIVTAVSLVGYPIFQDFVERKVLHIALPSRELQQAYSAHITSSNSFSELTSLLDEEVMPNLLVRQFVFLLVDEGNTRVLLSRGVAEDQIPTEGLRALPLPLIGRAAVRVLGKDRKVSWIRLALPLKVQDKMLGIWLFGRRDPDDVYSNIEIPILQLLANQTAIALSNILQSQRLRAMYQADIDRHENERLSLARDLHDSVLSELAGMLMNADIGTLPKNFQDGYRTLTQHLREIVSDLRPPMLNYGLKPAIEELADNLMERTKDEIDIEVELESEGDRYPTDKEQHLFRIVQEACENAVRHSRGKIIKVSGRLAPDEVDISIADDGDGFRLGKDDVQLYALLSERHFGLAGMLERAELINADIRIDSLPGAGTRINLRWRANTPAVSADQGLEDSSS